MVNTAGTVPTTWAQTGAFASLSSMYLVKHPPHGDFAIGMGQQLNRNGVEQ